MTRVWQGPSRHHLHSHRVPNSEKGLIVIKERDDQFPLRFASKVGHWDSEGVEKLCSYMGRSLLEIFPVKVSDS